MKADEGPGRAWQCRGRTAPLSHNHALFGFTAHADPPKRLSPPSPGQIPPLVGPRTRHARAPNHPEALALVSYGAGLLVRARVRIAERGPGGAKGKFQVGRPREVATQAQARSGFRVAQKKEVRGAGAPDREGAAATGVEDSNSRLCRRAHFEGAVEGELGGAGTCSGGVKGGRVGLPGTTSGCKIYQICV